MSKKTKYHAGMMLLGLCLLLVSAAPSLPARELPPDKNGMITLHSYHRGRIWDDDIALKLHPQTRHIIVYGDNSPTCQANCDFLGKIISDYEGSFDFIFLENRGSPYPKYKSMPDFYPLTVQLF